MKRLALLGVRAVGLLWLAAWAAAHVREAADRPLLAAAAAVAAGAAFIRSRKRQA